MTRLRTVVIGAGQRFTEVAAAAAAAGRLDIVAVVDPSPAARERGAGRGREGPRVDARANSAWGVAGGGW